MFHELTNKLIESINEEAGAVGGGGTTMSAISYTPGSFGDVRRRLSSLGKTSLDLNIVEDKQNKSRRVLFDELEYSVTDDDWSEFEENVLKGQREGKLILSEELNEDLGEEYDRAMSSLQESLIEAYDTQPLEQLDSRILNFKTLFGLRKYLKKDALVDYQDKQDDLYRVLQDIQKAYPSDVGYIELISKALDEKTPLTMYAPFKDYDEMYGVRIKSNYRKVGLIYDVSADTTFDISESLWIDDPSVTDRLEEDTRVKVVNKQIFPTKGGFDKKFFITLKDIIDEVA